MDSPVLQDILAWEQKEDKHLGARIRREGQAERIEGQAIVLYDQDGDVLGMEILGTPKVVRDNGLDT